MGGEVVFYRFFETPSIVAANPLWVNKSRQNPNKIIPKNLLCELAEICSCLIENSLS